MLGNGHGDTGTGGHGEQIRRAAVALLLCVITVASFGGCSKAKQPPPRVVPVVAETADRKNVPLQVKAIGNVEAYNTVTIKSQVNGEISEVYFREGQDVRKGKLLFRIDPRPFESALRQAESALVRDRAQAVNAKEDSKRYAALAGKGYVSVQEYDKARTNADALDAVVKADEAAVENARLQLEYTAIMSPIDGQTGAITIQKGNVVKANDLPLVTINQITPIYVTFSVPEQDLANIKRYQTSGDLHVEVSIPQSSKKTVKGSLDVHRQQGEHHDRDDHVESHLCEPGPGPLAGTVRRCRPDPDNGTGPGRGPLPGGADRPAGPVCLCDQGRYDR